MWLVLNDAYLSIVADPADPNGLLVRARLSGDIEKVFPTAKVTKTPARDYLFRAFLPRTMVAEIMASRIESIDYGNFKDSVPQRERHDAYFRIWTVMHNMQEKNRARTPMDRTPWDFTDIQRRTKGGVRAGKLGNVT